jgi:hypothetical protein
MADLKPIGSEKLQGQDKINRILELSRYKETTPSNINETSRVEFGKTLADGVKYEIVKEKNGYIIKKRVDESLEYIDPMKNRTYYRSYSQALKRMNLLAGEINRLTENTDEVSMFTLEEQKYTLKLPKSAAPTPAPAPAPEAPIAPAPETDSPEMSMDLDSEMGGDDMGGDMEMDTEMDIDTPEGDMEMDTDVSSEPEGEEVNFKMIQKLTGKLGQKIRMMNDAVGMSSEDIKYVINSIMSALDLNKLDDEDKDDIMAKFEEDSDYGMGDEEGDFDISGEDEFDMDTEVDMEEPVEGEMGEGDDMYLGIGDHGFYDKSDRQMNDFNFDYDEEEYDDFDDFISKYPNQNWFRKGRSDDAEFGRDSSDRKFWDKYKEQFGGPFKLRKRRGEMGENVYGSFDREQWYDKEDRPFKGGFDFDFDEEEFDEFEPMMKKHGDGRWFQKGSDGKRMFDMYKDKHGPMKIRSRKMGEMSEEDKATSHISKVMDEIFAESKVDKVLESYFVINESENKVKQNKLVTEKKERGSIMSNVRQLSETVEQELASEFILKENKNFKFVGKTNKKNLVFEHKGEQIKVSPKGEIL